MKSNRVRVCVSDLMILVAALAVGMAWRGAVHKNDTFYLNKFQEEWTDDDHHIESWLSGDTSNRLIQGMARGWDILQDWLPCLATATVALTYSSLRTRRLRRVAWKSAGACGIVLASAFLLAEVGKGCLLTLQGLVKSGWRLEVDGVGQNDYFLWSLNLVPRIEPSRVALGIVAAWVVLGVTGRWRIGPFWQDRAGFVVGLIWIGIGLVAATEPWVLRASAFRGSLM